MSKILIGMLLMIGIGSAQALTPIATCGEMKGYSYIPDIPEYSKDKKSLKQKLADKIADETLPENWVSDGFKNGTINFVVLKNGNFDVVIYNQVRNETFSTIEDGGKVFYMRGSSEEIVFLITYPSTVSVYTIVKTKKGNKVSVVESKNGMVLRTSMFSGSCNFVNFTMFK
jgi:hypothetical protein